MKKIMNCPPDFVDQSLSGIIAAHKNRLKTHPENIRAVVRAEAPVQDKVAIVTGGGYGHLPLFLGYVGDGMCDGCAVGNVFTSPSCSAVVDATGVVNAGRGVLYLIGNYMGDQMNFEMASDMAAMEGIETDLIRASDDIASADREHWQDRRGVAGIVFAYKIAGMAARRGGSLAEVAAVTRKACERIATYGVAFSSCQLPESDAPIFSLKDDEMELGIGIHGEKGQKRCKMMTAAELAQFMTEQALNDLSVSQNARVGVIVNGLGSTSQEELYILYNEVAKILENKQITVVRSLVGEYVTSMEMAGASVTIFNLDEELEGLLMEPTSTPFVTL